MKEYQPVGCADPSKEKIEALFRASQPGSWMLDWERSGFTYKEGLVFHVVPREGAYVFKYGYQDALLISHKEARKHLGLKHYLAGEFLRMTKKLRPAPLQPPKVLKNDAPKP